MNYYTNRGIDDFFEAIPRLDVSREWSLLWRCFRSEPGKEPTDATPVPR